MNAAENYLRDMLQLLLIRAKEAKSLCDDARARDRSNGSGFECGRALAYYEVLSSLINQLGIFGLSLSQVGLDEDFDVDRALL